MSKVLNCRVLSFFLFSVHHIFEKPIFLGILTHFLQLFFFKGSWRGVLWQVKLLLQLLPRSGLRNGPEKGASLDDPLLAGEQKPGRGLAPQQGLLL